MVQFTLVKNRIEIGDGLDFITPSNHQTWTINPGVIVESLGGNGVDSNGSVNNTLINHGKVSALGVSQYGVFLFNGFADVANMSDGRISGGDIGVVINNSGPTSTVDNLGAITGAGLAGLFFGAGAQGIAVNNHGSIFGGSDGVYNDSSLSGGVILNHGSIRSHGDGIYLDTASGLVTHITNFAGGVIQGSMNSLEADVGRVDLVNDGTMVGDISVDYRTVILNHGTIHGQVFLSNFSDTFIGTGGTSGAIHTEGGNDRIVAGNGNVVVWIDAGGNCTLTAGPGHDQFRFNLIPTAGEVEKFTNFNPGHDTMALEESFGFPGLGPVGTLTAAHFHVGLPATGAAQIDYTPGDGFVYFAASGNGGPLIHFATVTPHTHLTHADFLVTG